MFALPDDIDHAQYGHRGNAYDNSGFWVKRAIDGETLCFSQQKIIGIYSRSYQTTCDNLSSYAGEWVFFQVENNHRE